MTRFFFERSEIELLIISIVFQIISLITLLRVATGIAAFSPPSNSTSSAIVVPINLSQSITIPYSTPQFVAPAQGSISASFLLALVFVGANVVMIGFLAYLYRRKKMKWFSLFISLFLVFIVTELYFTFISGLSSWIPLVASFAALGITVVAAYRGSIRLTNARALIIALELGSSFPVLLQAPLNWIIPAVYAVFDIYAVYYGRLGKLVKEVAKAETSTSPPSDLAGGAKSLQTSTTQDVSKGSVQKGLLRWPDFGLLSVRLTGIEIGMADIAFYTMVPAAAALLVTHYSIIAFLVVMAFVDVGIVISFSLFRKREVSPGLPVPILLGLAGLFFVSLII